ncbi:MAG: DUF4382 domain-containing protein [Nitrososphaerales archaeon]
MSAKRSTFKYGVAAVLIAIAIIMGSIVVNPEVSQLMGSTRVGQTGTLAAQITDPPNVPENVTNVYISYSSIEVHITGVGNESGWYTIAKPGETDLMKVLSVSLTLGSAPVQSGTYNLVRFDIISAQVTYNGRNVSASVPSNVITVPITKGGITVNSGGSAGLLIDLSPTVIPYQNGTAIGFVLVPAAQGLPIPSQDWNSDMEREGSQMNVGNQSWLQQDEGQLAGNLTIQSATLTPNGLTVVVKNVGSTNVSLNSASILANSSQLIAGDNDSGDNQSTNDIYEDLPTVAAFQILPNGTVVQPGEQHNSSLDDASGLVLQSGHSTTLTFKGPIVTLQEGAEGSDNSSSLGSVSYPILAGQHYIVEIFGDFETTAVFAVTASA